MYSATYSPEDNKLRLYSVSKLDAGTYARVKAAGFIWAPKQGLFVAPAWTPGREDLLLELCGEITDEDTSLVDRAEQRAERFDDYADHRQQDAKTAHKAVSAIADNIPFGQPILVGHHSEKHARKDAERIENGMRKAVRMWEQSQYWTDRAQGAIKAAKYKERPDVRARRIKKLEAEERKQLKGITENQRRYDAWKSIVSMDGADEVIPADLETANKAQRAAYTLANDGGSWWTAYHPTCEEANAKAREIWHHGFSTYDLLTKTEFIGTSFTPLTPKQMAELYIKTTKNPSDPDHSRQRWSKHYANRLAYERAMLADQGGAVADRLKPEKGGACKCWASHRAGWSYITKVNKVSVTVLDNWGNGGNNFTRTIPFDKLAGMMSAADVQAARDCGTLIEYGDKTGFCLRGNGNDGEATRLKTKVAAPKTGAQPFEAMRETLRAGVQIVSAPQLFPTPAEIAEKMVEHADIRHGDQILEPSAGTGNILAAIGRNRKECKAVAVEIVPALAESLKSRFMVNVDVRCADFLDCDGDLGTFDRIVMNPPFENGSDIKHIEHAFTMLKPGGKLVALCANGPRQREAFMDEAKYWEDLPDGSFKEAGTGVNVALMVLSK